jgi:hypothetical protein
MAPAGWMRRPAAISLPRRPTSEVVRNVAAIWRVKL